MKNFALVLTWRKTSKHTMQLTILEAFFENQKPLEF